MRLIYLFSEIKQNFCNKIIINLDKIISKCSSRKDKQYINNMLDEAEEFKDFSEKFYKNKEILKLGIEELKEQNESYKLIIQGLFIHYKNKNDEEIKHIFKLLGYEFKEEIKWV